MIPGLSGATLRRGIVNDGEVLTIRQGPVSVSFEFDAAVNGGGTASGQHAGGLPAVAARWVTSRSALAAAINNNKGGLNVSAEAELDANNVPTGLVLLNDQPGTIIDVFQAPTLNVIGVPGGATPINITPRHFRHRGQAGVDHRDQLGLFGVDSDRRRPWRCDLLRRERANCSKGHCEPSTCRPSRIWSAIRSNPTVTTTRLNSRFCCRRSGWTTRDAPDPRGVVPADIQHRWPMTALDT